MGAATSAPSCSSPHLVYSLVLSAAVLYVVWRQGQIAQEMKRLRCLLDASVSLHELEEEVMPAIDSLEQEAWCLKREMQQLARRACDPRTDTVTDELARKKPEERDVINIQPSFDEFEEEDRNDEDFEVLDDLVNQDVPSMLVNMGLNALLRPEALGSAVGVPTTRVLLTSCSIQESATAQQPLIEECAAEPVAAED